MKKKKKIRGSKYLAQITHPVNKVNKSVKIQMNVCLQNYEWKYTMITKLNVLRLTEWGNILKQLKVGNWKLGEWY